MRQHACPCDEVNVDRARAEQFLGARLCGSPACVNVIYQNDIAALDVRSAVRRNPKSAADHFATSPGIEMTKLLGRVETAQAQEVDWNGADLADVPRKQCGLIKSAVP